MTSRRVGRVGPTATALVAGLLVSLAPCCDSYQPGITVSVGVMHQFAQQGAASPPTYASGDERAFATNLGYQVRLDSGYVGIQTVELVQCDDAPAAPASTARRLWRVLRAPALAHAHTLNGPSYALGVPYVDDLLRADHDVFTVGSMEPPPARYCGAKVMIGPADADAVALPAGVDMVGRSLHLVGRFRTAGSTGAWQPLRVDSNATHEVDISLETIQHGQPTGLILDADHLDAQVVINLNYNLWLDDVNLYSASSADLEAAVLANLDRTIYYAPPQTTP